MRKNTGFAEMSASIMFLASVYSLSGCGKNMDSLPLNKVSDDDVGFAASPPTAAALSAEFTDTAVRGGSLSGTVGITRASDERSISHYVVYWGSGAETKLAGVKELAVLPKGSAPMPLVYEFPQSTVKPKEASHLLVRTKNPYGEMSSGVSVPIVDKGLPVNAAVSLSFNDTELTGGWLAGTLSITKASDEKDVSHYCIYWGDSLNRKLSSVPIQEMLKTGGNLTVSIKERIKKPLNATHFIVLTKNSDGEMTEGISTPIVDKGVPENAATSLGFTDTNINGGRLNGIMTISRAANESDVTSYAIYWGRTAEVIAENTPIAVVNKNNSNLEAMMPAGTIKPADVTHLIVRTRNADGEMSTGVSVPIIDKGVPVNAAMSIAFQDTNLVANRLDGTVNITRAANESDVTHYVLYWGQSPNAKSVSTPITSLAKTGSNLSFTFPPETMRAASSSHLLVYTQNADGEMFTGASTILVDKGLPENAAAAIAFTDNDLDGGRLDGNVIVTKALIDRDISSYVLYWGSSESTKLSSRPFSRLLKGGSLVTTIFRAVKPTGATHILVFTANEFGEMATGRGVAIIDKGVPVNSAVALSYTDTELIAGRLGGTIFISKALNESDLTKYSLYWGKSPTSKLATTPFATLNKTGANLSHVLLANTVKPTGATHILAFTGNNDGEMSSAVSTLIVDRGAPVDPPVSVSFSDTDLSADRLFGTISIGKSPNESNLTHYVLYWGSDSSTKLNHPAIATIEKTGSNVLFSLPTVTFKPTAATHILAFTRNHDLEMERGVSTQILDKAAPTNAASAISFTDTDATTGRLSGIAFLTKASNEIDVTHYALYWGSGPTMKLSSDPIATIAKTGGNLTHSFSTGTIKPTSATHLLVFTRNIDGEMTSSVNVAIVDKGWVCGIPDSSTSAAAFKLNGKSCTGNLIASGSLNDSEEDLADAVKFCNAGDPSRKATCCSMHIFGRGMWYLTDGSVTTTSDSVGIPNEASFGIAAGACAFVGGTQQTATPTATPTATSTATSTATPTAMPTATPVSTSVTSCVVSAGALCSEGFAASEIALVEFNCSLENGTLAKGVACPTANKIKGCRQSRNGQVVLTIWTYTNAAVPVIESACQSVGTTLVMP